MRHPVHPDRYLLSRSRSPELVEADDICEFDMDSRPVRETGHRYYAERVIHGCLYAARPDVGAVCHLHAPSVLPFANTGIPIVPVLHVGAVLGFEIPFWDARDEFGDTDMLVSTLAQGHSLAAAAGSGWAVIMRRHGAVVAGVNVRDTVFRAINLKLNAEVQIQAQALGQISPLTRAEVEMSSSVNLKPVVQERTWEYWASRLRNKANLEVAAAS
jgi:HCOMODA/2-hydroxy-3-carboxy-muconic semialdehyde decarboxylase